MFWLANNIAMPWHHQNNLNVCLDDTIIFELLLSDKMLCYNDMGCLNFGSLWLGALYMIAIITSTKGDTNLNNTGPQEWQVLEHGLGLGLILDNNPIPSCQACIPPHQIWPKLLIKARCFLAVTLRSSNIRLKNVLPGFTTLHACWSLPASPFLDDKIFVASRPSPSPAVLPASMLVTWPLYLLYFNS